MKLKSCEKYPWLVTDEEGSVYNSKTKRPYKPFLDKYGYHKVSTTYQGKKVRVFVHRAVAHCWLPKPEDKNQINHINGIKTDNSVENLEWCTGSENHRHAINTGLRKIQHGSETSSAQHTEEDIHAVCKLLAEGHRNCDIEKRTGVSRSKVKDIRSGRSWPTVSQKYSFARTSRRRKLSDDTIHWICRMLQEGFTVKQILESTRNKNVTEAIIYHIRDGKTASEISKEYHW